MVFEPGFELWVEFGLAKMGVEKRCFWEREQTEPRHKGMKILDWVLWIDYGSIPFKWNIQKWEQLERWMGTCLFLEGFTWPYSGGRGVVDVWEWCGENSPWGYCCVKWIGEEQRSNWPAVKIHLHLNGPANRLWGPDCGWGKGTREERREVWKFTTN